MILTGSPDLSAVTTFGSGRIYRAFGGGPTVLAPQGCEVLPSPDGALLWHLDIARALDPRAARATLDCTIGADFATGDALALLRPDAPAASVVACPLTDWVFRVAPTPALSASWDLTAPVPVASAGLGSGRLLVPLSMDSAVLLESMLRDGGSLWGNAEATIEGVSPRLPAVIRFDPAVLVDAVRAEADVSGALPFKALVAFFRRDPADLPVLDISGSTEADVPTAFAEAMADRIVSRFGGWVAAQDPSDAPVVSVRPSDPGTVIWSLSEPVLAQRRIVLPVDLLGRAREQAAQRGLASLVTRRDLATLPPLGQARVTVLSTLPTVRTGVDVLGVEVEFPPYPPNRPQPRGATAELVGDDPLELEVELSPGEPLCYQATPFAVVADELGSRRLDGSPLDGEDPVLRLGPGNFPVDLAICAVSPALAGLAVVSGTCTFERVGEVYLRRFVLDSGRLTMAVAVPSDSSWLRLDMLAVARDGSGEIRLGPFESAPVRLDLSSFPTYGPQQVTLRCVFDDGSATRAVSLRPAGLPDSPDNITTVVLTPQEPVRVYRWFSASPFAAGVRYRLYGSAGEWRAHQNADGELLLLSSQLEESSARREVTLRPGGVELGSPRPGLRVTESVVAGRETAVAGDGPETAVAPVATSPSPAPTDELVYVRTDDPSRKSYIPRYGVDVQAVSGQPAYGISMATTSAASTLTIRLVASPPGPVASQAPDATELPHVLGVALEFLLAAGSGATKTLEFTDVTRSGAVVTAVLSFATLAERDDVYGALTDPGRQARLLARRQVDLLVPVPAAAGAVPEFPVGVLMLPDRLVLPDRPVVAWPPRLTGRPFPPQPDPDPVIATDPTAPATRWDGILTAAGGRSRPPTEQTVPTGVLLSAAPDQTAKPVLVNALTAQVLTGIPVTVARERAARVAELRRTDDDDGIGGNGHGGGGGPRGGGPAAPALPMPRLSLLGQDRGPGVTRVRVGVGNWAEFSDDFFAASPDLAPCGRNTSAARTWIDILDARSGARLYGFCALSTASQLSELWFPVTGGAAVPEQVQVRMTDRRTGVSRTSNAVPTAAAEPPPPGDPAYQPVRREFQQTVLPQPFAFSPVLHSYIFEGITPSGSGNRLIRRSLVHDGRWHTYLQDASRPRVVYVFPDAFKIARRPSAPFTPFATVRVTSSPDGQAIGVVFDYVVAPHVDQQRLADARAQLLADPQFGEQRIEFQPFTTSDVSFSVDRPTESGSVREDRPDAALVLQGSLKDTLSMPLADFQLLFDAMHGQTASLFLGHVDIAVGDGAEEIIPFTARMDDLEGDLFACAATAGADGTLDVRLTNCIESPVDVQTLGVTLLRDGVAVRSLVKDGLPREGLHPGESVPVHVQPEAALPSGPAPELVLDLSGVTVQVDAEAVWNSILDRTTLAYFRMVTVKVVSTIFDPVPGHEGEQIRVIVIEFEGGGTAELQAPATADPSKPFVEAAVRVDYPIDDVILHRPVSSTYRYTVTVVRANGQQQRDTQPTTGSAPTLYVSVAR